MPWKTILVLLVLLHNISFSAFAQKRKDTTIQLKFKPVNQSYKDTFSIFFKVGSIKLDQESVQQLDSLRGLMNGKEKIQINGYADKRGDIKSNIILSEERAASVKYFFVQKGIPDSNITHLAYGVEESENDATSLQKARRVDLVYKINCSDSSSKKKFRPFYFVFGQTKLDDSTISELNKLANYLRKNSCLKANLYIYKICETCKSEESKKLDNKNVIEDKSLIAIRKKELYDYMNLKGVNDHQITIQCLSLGCISSINKSISNEIQTKDEEILKKQRRVDVQLSKR